MAGTQKYTSSLFIQSGSRAKFESGLEVTESIHISGPVTASGYFDLEGNEITGGTTAEFFAGSASGISQSTPSSIDIFHQLPSGEILTSDVTIHTTHSNTFLPNHYAFVKITDEFTTVQSGGLDKSNYNLGSLGSGVYRYLVYGAQTGSGGETHQIYTTVFIKGFFNEAPNLALPTAPTLSIAHDATTGSLILFFTNSEDPNPEDAISYFTASRVGEDPSGPPNDTQSTYTLVMSHSNFSGNVVTSPNLLQTSSNYSASTHNGLGKDVGYANTLFFTASIKDYSIVDNNSFIHYINRFDEEVFNITLKDENEIIDENSDGDLGVTGPIPFTVRIEAPPTASISNIKVKFENDGFTGIDADTLTHTLLYDRTESLSSASIAELDDRYTSSLIRLSTRADIIPPTGYDPSSTVTEIKIPTQSSGEDIKFQNNFKFVKFVGANGGSTASFFNTSSDGFNALYSPTESLGYTSFTFKPTNFTNNTQSIDIGVRNSSKDDLNKTAAIRHGNNNHYEAFITAPNTLTFQNIPHINISDIVVEVESGSWGTNAGYPSLTSSLLYGYTSSLLSSQTQSALIALIPTGSSDTAVEHPQYNNYVSSSVVRLRVKAKITEPFGPDHKPITFTLTGSKDDNSLQFSKVFTFSTHSGTDCIDSSSNYNSETKQRLVGTYTSSWQDFNFPSGIYNFTTQLASSSNAGSTIDTISTAVVSMSNYNNVELSNLVYETEHSGLTGSGVNDVNIVTSTTRSVLYGHEHSIFGISSSYHNHPSSSLYASHSLFRMRVRGKITEPFGPATSKLDFTFKNKGPSTVPLDPLTNAFTINTTSSNVFINNQLVTVFTSSLIGKNITFENVPSYKGPSKQTDYTISGSVTFDEDSTEEFIGTSNLSINNPTISQIAVIDTPATIIENISYETETFGHSKIDSTNTTRSILYGDPHITNANSASATWVNHPSASTYTSHSVTRFRVKTKITEPIGFLVHSSSFENQWISSSQYSSSQLDFFTGSSAIEFSSSAYDTQGRLVVVYTSSFMGAILSSSKLEGTNYLFTSGNILHEPVGENKFTTASGVSSNVLVKDTSPTIIEDISYETETFGHSNITSTSTTRSVLYGDPHITNATSESATWVNHPSASTYASHSVTRFRVKAKVTEPLGFLVHSSSFENKWISSSVYSSSKLDFFTGSSAIEFSSSVYDIQGRLVVVYTSSFMGAVLSSSVIDGTNYLFTSGNILHEPIGENKFTTESGVSSNVLVKDTPRVLIEKVHEFEEFGHSASNALDSGILSTTRTVLYGDPHITNATSESATWVNHPSASTYASHSVTRARLRVKITEPLGYVHDKISFAKKIGLTSWETINAFTGSTNFEKSSSVYDSQDRLVVNYTESWKGRAIELSPDKRTAGNTEEFIFFTDPVTQTITGENGIINSNTNANADITVKNTLATQITINKIETETFGESGVALGNTNSSTPGIISRSIIAGESTTRATGSGILNSLTGSSVTRFKIFAIVNEPLGPLHFGTKINSIFNPFEGNNSPQQNSPVQLFSTNSQDIETSSSLYINDKLQTTYESLFTGSELSTSQGSDGIGFYKTSPFVDHNPPGENSNTTTINSNLYFAVSGANNFYQIEDTVIEVESGSFGTGIGHPNLTSSVLYGFTSSLLPSQTQSLITDILDNPLIHPHHKSYLSQSVVRLRIKTKIIEPFGISEHQTITCSIKLGSNTPAGAFNNLPLNLNPFHFDTSSADVTDGFGFEAIDGVEKLVARYTSSFVAIRIPTGSYEFTSSITSGYEFLNINPITTSSVIMNSVAPARFQDIHYETEEYGYAPHEFNDSNVVNSSHRTILYGDSHFTNEGTGSSETGESWANHVSASTYASHSVTRFRVRGKLIEPFGPGTTKCSITLNINKSSYSDINFGESFIIPTNDGNYNLNRELVTPFTSSFKGVNIDLIESDYSNSDILFNVSGNISYTPTSSNGFNVTNVNIGDILISDTPQTEIKDIIYETETSGLSNTPTDNTTRTILYGDHEVTNATPIGTVWETHTSASVYSSHSVSRFRVKAKVIEPLGPLHHSSSFEKKWESTDYNTSSLFNFFTGSTDVLLSSSFYDNKGRLITAYTTSFIGAVLSSSNQAGLNYLFTSGNILHEPEGENAYTTASGEDANIIVKNTPSVQISINKIEINSGSFSDGYGESDNNSTPPDIIKFIPFNSSSTTGNSSLNINLQPNTLTRFRILANIIEPIGYIHTPTNIRYSKQNHNTSAGVGNVISFATNSADIFNSSSGYNDNTQYVASYTSSFQAESLEASSPNYWLFYILNAAITQTNPTEPSPSKNAPSTSRLRFIVSSSENENLEISNTTVEVESGSYGFNNGHPNLTSSLLYGLTSSLLSAQTQSFIIDQVGESHPLIEEYTSASIIRLRVKSKVVEPYGDVINSFNSSFNDGNSLNSPTFLFGEENLLPADTNIAGDVISQSAFNFNFSDGLPRIISTYTSSWVEFNFIKGTFTFSPSFTAPSPFEPAGINIDTTNQQLAVVSMSATLPTQLTNLNYETETFGFSEVSTNNTTRTILYGDNHFTNNGTQSLQTGESWANHVSASTYASHSVTRFKVSGQIIEPFGPATSNLEIDLTNEGTILVDNFNSLDTVASGKPISAYNNSKLVTNFETSFDDVNAGVSLTVSNGENIPSLETQFNISGSVSYGVNSNNIFPGTNILNINTPTTTSLKVLDTAATEIIITKIETETQGESNIGISNNNQSTPGIISRSIFNGTTTLETGSGTSNLFTGSVVTRFRILTNIIEPLGYLHFGSQIKLNFSPDLSGNSNNLTTDDFQTFSTNSADIFNLSSEYDEQVRLVTSYTSSFNGKTLGASEPGYWKVGIHDIDHNPNSENGHNFTDTNAQLYFVVSESFSNITVPTITNLKVEVEEDFSGSGNFVSTRHTNILHGTSSTETNETINASFTHLDSKKELVGVRVIATIEEPPQGIHNAVTIEIGGHSSLETITFATNSNDIDPTSLITPPTAFAGLTGNYTSKFIPILLNADGNTSNPLTDNSEKLDYKITASVVGLSIQSDIVPDVIYAGVSTASVFVTGALSSSTLIDLTLPSTISSSEFGSSEGTSFYYTYNSHLTSDTNLNFIPTLTTTPPPFSKESNIVFTSQNKFGTPTAGGHLNIKWTTTSDHIITASYPNNGIGTLRLDESDIDGYTNLHKFELKAEVTNSLEGNGANSTSQILYIIPSQPQIMNGNDWTKSFKNHESLGLGESNLYKASLPKGLVYYENSEELDKGTQSSKIFITSKSDGTGNDYTITLTTPSSYTGDYGDNTRAYGYGDTGSLVIKINDSEVVNASLKDNFINTSKSASQDLTEYDNGGFTNGTASFSEGNLVLNKVAPFNNVSQSINNDNIYYPNGYQAWNATLTINQKIRNGYNKIDFEHRIFPGVTHSLNTVDWYYDDGLANPQVDSTKTITWNEYSSSPTHSLSGISYFIKNTDFNLSIDNVFLNLANKTYRQADNNAYIAYTKETNSDHIDITAGDGSPSNQSILYFELNNTENRNGLVINPQEDFIIPSITSTGSVTNIRVKGTGTINNNNGLGTIREIEFGVYNRDLSSNDTWNQGDSFHTPIGRFISSVGSDSGNLIENFDKETFRLQSSSVTDNYLEGLGSDFSLFTSLLTGTINSADSIVNTGELQQLIGGELSYPITQDYIGLNPNSINYNVNFNTSFPVRHYFRAFAFDFTNNTTVNNAGFSSNKANANKFTLKLTYKVANGITDINALNEFVVPSGTSFDTETDYINGITNKISIAVRLPGSVSSTTQTNSNPGTNWGIINDRNFNSSFGIPPNSSIWAGLDPQGFSNQGATINTSTNTISIPVLIGSSFRLAKVNGVILLRIAIHNSFQGIIEKIEFEGR